MPRFLSKLDNFFPRMRGKHDTPTGPRKSGSKNLTGKVSEVGICFVVEGSGLQKHPFLSSPKSLAITTNGYMFHCNTSWIKNLHSCTLQFTLNMWAPLYQSTPAIAPPIFHHLMEKRPYIYRGGIYMVVLIVQLMQ